MCLNESLVRERTAFYHLQAMIYHIFYLSIHFDFVTIIAKLLIIII